MVVILSIIVLEAKLYGPLSKNIRYFLVFVLYLTYFEELPMFLKKDTATKIIEEISMILDYDINMMDEKGAILASTDPSRVGMFHEGAFRIIHNQLAELPVYEDDEYQGCRKGINLPIFLKDKIIGVIGVTGEVSEVMKYGKVLKKMTEILVLDLFSYHRKSQEEQDQLFFMNEWVNKDPSAFDSYFHNKLHAYGFAEKAPYTAALITPPSLLDEMDGFQKQCRCLYGQNGNLGLMIFSAESLELIVRSIRKAQTTCGNPSFLCTVGALQQDYTGVKRSYEQAQKLMALKSGHQGLFCYESCIGELIFHDVALTHREILTNQLLSSFSDEERLEFAAFMAVYVKNNGSVSQIAKELFIHKNTVQYKINKIWQRTGRDPRVIEDAVLLMMAASWIHAG